MNALRLVARIGLWAVCAVMSLRKGYGSLKYRLLRHFLGGTGRALDLGMLPIEWAESRCNPDDQTTVVALEESWISEGFRWFVPSCDDSTWHKAFGGFYGSVDEGRDVLECRDLYDWHDLGAEGWPNSIVMSSTIKASEKTAAALNKALEWFYGRMGVLELCNCEEPAYSVNGRLNVELPDGLWPRLGGKEFVTKFEVTTAEGWAHDYAMGRSEFDYSVEDAYDEIPF